MKHKSLTCNRRWQAWLVLGPLICMVFVTRPWEAIAGQPRLPDVPGREFTDQIEVPEVHNVWTVFFANKGKQPAFDDWWMDDAKWKAALAKKGEGKREPVTFKLWIPEGTTCLRGLVVASGHGSGVSLYGREDMRKIAVQLHLGLLTFIGNNMQRGFWPTSLFYDELKKLTVASQHPELENLPFFLYGHSNGTGFSGIFPAHHPERVWGWVSMRPGAVRQVCQPKAAGVPGMVMFGETDHFFTEPSPREYIDLIGRLRKEHSSMIHMVVQPGGTHAPDARAWELVYAFLKESFAERVPVDSDPLKGVVKLKSLKLENGCLGQNWDPVKGGRQELVVTPYPQFKGDLAGTSWLINAAYAKAWQEFQR